MTGAGKTHTMFGSGVLKSIANRPIEEGIANLAIRALFSDS